MFIRFMLLSERLQTFVALGNFLHGLSEVEPVFFHHKRNTVAGRVAPETVEKVPALVHVETGGFFVVKRAAGREAAGLALELQRVGLKDLRNRQVAHGLRSVEHNGGLDNWLVKTSDDKLSLRCRRLKRDIVKKRAAAAVAA